MEGAEGEQVRKARAREGLAALQRQETIEYQKRRQGEAARRQKEHLEEELAKGQEAVEAVRSRLGRLRAAEGEGGQGRHAAPRPLAADSQAREEAHGEYRHFQRAKWLRDSQRRGTARRGGRGAVGRGYVRRLQREQNNFYLARERVRKAWLDEGAGERAKGQLGVGRGAAPAARVRMCVGGCGALSRLSHSSDLCLAPFLSPSRARRHALLAARAHPPMAHARGIADAAYPSRDAPCRDAEVQLGGRCEVWCAGPWACDAAAGSK